MEEMKTSPEQQQPDCESAPAPVLRCTTSVEQTHAADDKTLTDGRKKTLTHTQFMSSVIHLLVCSFRLFKGAGLEWEPQSLW